MPVDWTDDPTAFAGRDWTPLVERDPDGTFFHTPRYLKLYWEELAPPGFAIALIGDGAEATAACAFELRDGVLAFLGGTEVTDYLGPVGLPAVRRRAALELVASLAARDDWSEARLAGLPEEGAWLPALAEAARTAGLPASIAKDSTAPFLQLESTYEGYLASLAGKLRREIRRKRRRLLGAAPEARLIDATPETVGPQLGRFFDLHRASPGEKGRFMGAEMELFFRRLGHELIADGTLRLTLLELAGETIAGTLGFRDRDRFLLYNSAFAQEHAGLSPGMVLLDLLIEDVIREGFRAVDMLRGDLDYKYRFGARPRRICRLLIRRP